MIPKSGLLRSLSAGPFTVRAGLKPEIDATEQKIREFAEARSRGSHYLIGICSRTAMYWRTLAIIDAGALE
jgi:hypothetical protein